VWLRLDWFIIAYFTKRLRIFFVSMCATFHCCKQNWLISNLVTSSFWCFLGVSTENNINRWVDLPKLKQNDSIFDFLIVILKMVFRKVRLAEKNVISACVVFPDIPSPSLLIRRMVILSSRTLHCSK
jgi:hypothetical protein